VNKLLSSGFSRLFVWSIDVRKDESQPSQSFLPREFVRSIGGGNRALEDSFLVGLG
jgi:hypothetical protein